MVYHFELMHICDTTYPAEDCGLCFCSVDRYQTEMLGECLQGIQHRHRPMASTQAGCQHVGHAHSLHKAGQEPECLAAGAWQAAAHKLLGAPLWGQQGLRGGFPTGACHEVCGQCLHQC